MAISGAFSVILLTMTIQIRTLCAALAAASLLGGCATRPAGIVDINFVGMNDFHGNLDASKYAYTSVHTPGQQTLQAGGIDTIASYVQAWRN